MPFYVNIGRDVLAEAATRRSDRSASEFGATFVTDTCTYITPILEEVSGVVMTNSGKWAYYAPGNLGVEVVLGSLAECVESAVAGKDHGGGPMVTAATYRVLVPGRAVGDMAILDEPLSLWGGFDVETGRIIDQNHPQVGVESDRAHRRDATRAGLELVVVGSGRGPAAGHSTGRLHPAGSPTRFW